MTQYPTRLAKYLDKEAKINREMSAFSDCKNRLKQELLTLVNLEERQQIEKETTNELKKQLFPVIDIIQIQTFIRYRTVEKELTEQQAQLDTLYESRTAQIMEITKTLWEPDQQKVAQAELETLKTTYKVLEKAIAGTVQLSLVRKKYGLPSSATQGELIKRCKKDILANTETIKSESGNREQLLLLQQQSRIERKSLKCPKCLTALCLKDEKLVALNPTTAEKKDYALLLTNTDEKIATARHDAERLNKCISQLQAISIPLAENAQDVEEVKNKISKLKNYISQNISNEKILENLKHDNVLSKLSACVADKRDALKKLAQDVPDNVPDLNVLQKMVSEAKNREKIMAKITLAKTSLKSTTDKIAVCKMSIDKFKLSLEELPNHTELEMSEITEKIARLKSRHKLDMEKAGQVEAYSKWKEKKAELTRKQAQLKIATDACLQAELRHRATLVLKDCYLRAEKKAVESVVDSINKHTQYFLSAFFPENELSVTLKSDGKSIVLFKGYEYDTISQLSGGEFDRCTLASVCGANSMLNSPLLMLDESLSALDTDSNTEIIRFLGQLAGDKLILICSHEAVEGVFDTVIRI